MIRSKGLEKINLDDLVEELLPKGRALVPTKVKEDLLARIKNYLENDADYKKLTGYWRWKHTEYENLIIELTQFI